MLKTMLTISKFDLDWTKDALFRKHIFEGIELVIAENFLLDCSAPGIKNKFKSFCIWAWFETNVGVKSQTRFEATDLFSTSIA